MKQKFTNPFGGKDEQAINDHIEDLVGGPNNGFRMMRIYQDCLMHARGRGQPGASFMEKRSKHEVAADNFKKRAKREGFSDEAIDFYLEYVL